jgi:tetratricopeptide (TPR) repeat protein
MRKIYILIILIPFFSVAQKLEGQPRIDSLLVELSKMKEDTLKAFTLNELGAAYMNLEPTKGMKFNKEALKLSQKINYKTGITNGFRGIAGNFAVDADYENAILYYDLTLKSTRNPKVIGRTYGGLGYVYTQMNNYPKALIYHFKALKVHENSKDLAAESLTLNNIGTTYNNIKQPKKAILQFEKALLINQKIGSKTEEIRNFGNLGTSYNDLLDYNKALEYFNKAFKLADQIGQVGSKTINLYSIGLAYFNLKKYDKSIEFAEQSLKLSIETGNKMGLIKNYGLLGDDYLEKAKIENNNLLKANLLKNANSNFSKSINTSKEIGELSDLSQSLDRLSQIQKLQGNYKEALASHEQYVAFKDSILMPTTKKPSKT